MVVNALRVVAGLQARVSRRLCLEQREEPNLQLKIPRIARETPFLSEQTFNVSCMSNQCNQTGARALVQWPHCLRVLLNGGSERLELALPDLDEHC